MRVTTAVAIYFLVWWIVLFVVLPWGVRSQQESGDYAQGTDPGAPVFHRVWMKLVWTTVVATVVFALLAVSYIYNLIPLEAITAITGPRR